MATIPLTQKFHTLAESVNTENRGSASANANRTIFTMADIVATIGPGAGSITGSGTTNAIPMWDAATNITDSIITITATDVIIPQYIVHEGDANTKIGFSGTDTVRIQTAGFDRLVADGDNISLYHDTGVKKFETELRGTITHGQADLNDLNEAPLANDSEGVLGEIRWTAAFVYICTITGADGAANWNRAALTSGW
ncbi:MAG TPA: hypothetical protein EYO58_06145 [Flavobacteriales bacterium]|nr:hypothetical protein [Flavobacteriales bacterium]